MAKKIAPVSCEVANSVYPLLFDINLVQLTLENLGTRLTPNFLLAMLKKRNEKDNFASLSLLRMDLLQNASNPRHAVVELLRCTSLVDFPTYRSPRVTEFFAREEIEYFQAACKVFSRYDGMRFQRNSNRVLETLFTCVGHKMRKPRRFGH